MIRMKEQGVPVAVDLPDDLQDVAIRFYNWEPVYGFELHLLAEYVSQ